MPYTLRYIPNKKYKCYSVRRAKYKKGKRNVFSKCTTKTRAKKQLRLLRAIENNPKFILGQRRTMKKRSK